MKTALMLAALGGCPAMADDIVVDCPVDENYRVELWENRPIGQSFVATGGKVKTIGLNLVDACSCGFPGDLTMVLLLREGEGFDGTILGEFVSFKLPVGGQYWPLEWADWVHDASVSTVPGWTYTIEIVARTRRWEAFACMDWTVDGFYPDGSIWSGDEPVDRDFRFRVLEGLPGEDARSTLRKMPLRSLSEPVE